MCGVGQPPQKAFGVVGDRWRTAGERPTEEEDGDGEDLSLEFRFTGHS
jgi:hypothetical protein